MQTWEDLEKAIGALSPEQKKQPIQVIVHDSVEDNTLECLPGIAFDTVDALEFYSCRSTHNNKRVGTDFVLFCDKNPFAEDGATCYRWDTDTLEPIYGKEGKTKKEDQIGPRKEFSKHFDEVLRKRIEDEDLWCNRSYFD